MLVGWLVGAFVGRSVGSFVVSPVLMTADVFNMQTNINKVQMSECCRGPFFAAINAVEYKKTKANNTMKTEKKQKVKP